MDVATEVQTLHMCVCVFCRVSGCVVGFLSVAGSKCVDRSFGRGFVFLRCDVGGRLVDHGGQGKSHK